MTAMAIQSGYSGLGAWKSRQVASGVSDDATRLGNMLQSFLWPDSMQTATAQERYYQPLEALLELYRECAVQNWDGEGAQAVSEATINEAVDLLFLFPSQLPTPSFLAEPSGAIAFEWYKGPNKVLVATVDGTHAVQFAALLGEGNEAHGKANCNGSLPKAIRDLLDQFLKL